jgi:hypothetical protein
MDERSDVFGLGALLYEVASGKTPYGPRADPETLLERARNGQVVPIEDACRDIGVSQRLRSIVAKAVAPRGVDGRLATGSTT